MTARECARNDLKLCSRKTQPESFPPSKAKITAGTLLCSHVSACYIGGLLKSSLADISESENKNESIRT